MWLLPTLVLYRPHLNIKCLHSGKSKLNKNMSDENQNIDTIDLSNPELYINRETSLIEFNRRVLEHARDDKNPILERLRYLCISSGNLDEFFEIRVAGLKQQESLGVSSIGPDKKTPHEVLNVIRKNCIDVINEQYDILNSCLLPELEKEQIRFIPRDQWNDGQKEYLHKFFVDSLEPILSPLGIDPAHPFPRIQNKSLCFILSLNGKDAFGRNSGKAVIQAPISLPDVIKLPADQDDNGEHDYVFMSSIIHCFADELFHGMKVDGMYQFRVTRDSDLILAEDEMDDLVRAMEGQLLSRRYGDVVRLEIDAECPNDILNYLLKTLKLEETDVYLIHGPVNLSRFMSIVEMEARSELLYPPYTPRKSGKLGGNADIFKVLSKQDVMLHHPYDSFSPVIDFIRQAARDPNVLAIKQTLYRTGPNSAVVDALVEAATALKEVIVIIEIRARFDEADNIELANRLQQAGAQVVYGVVGFKTHVKMAMVVRREGKHFKRYVHLGTGNYHARTALTYVDYGLFSSDKELGEDVHHVFLQLTSLGKLSKLNKLIQSPFNMQKVMVEKINREAANAEKGLPAKIIVKLNALIEAQVIQALYRASMAGVEVKLIIRGICRLRPGIKGVSENIEVRSVVGRYLEHSRVLYFHNNNKPEVFCSSADWMERNFYDRVEICFPILSKKIADMLTCHLDAYLRDNTQSWILQPDGNYRRDVVTGEDAFTVQNAFMNPDACNKN